MSDHERLSWARITLAVIVAEILPILALVLVVVAYSFLRQAESLSPEEFAPMAGIWVGPIGGFLATLLLAWWVARRARGRRIEYGVAIGVGTALLDSGLGVLLGGRDSIGLLLVISNGGRILAGIVGGWLAARRGR